MTDKLKNKKLKTIHTDVLVIGGGYAGNFAAIKASEAGAKVVMAIKGRAGRSGLTPWANSFFVFHDTQGATREDYYKQFELSGEYLANMDYVNALMDEAYDRYLDLTEWGAITGRENYYQPATLTRSIEIVGSGDALRKKSIECGVELLERVMITSLIKPKDKIEGAIGFHMESGQPYAIIAKATIMCTGPSSLKPLGYGFPCSSATADGDAMAYRVGGEISGKEFNDGHPDSASNPFEQVTSLLAGDGITKKSPMELGGGPGGYTGPVTTMYGDLVGMRIDTSSIVHDRGLPIQPEDFPMPGMGMDCPKAKGYKSGATKEPAFEGDDMKGEDGGPRKMSSGYSTIGMSNHKAEGLFPYDAYGKTNLENLWAAGDSLSSMQNGAGYAGFGCSSAGSSVQGARSGKAAGEAVKTIEAPVVDESYIEDLVTEMFAPIMNEKGFSPAWVVQLMQNIMFPYFVMYIKEKSRLEAAISQIVYLQEQFADRLLVDDFHGLRVAHEARNMLIHAEMKLRSGLAREESRGTHIREDFPYRDDENFLCWIKLVKKDGKMVAVKHPIPEEWRPDKGIPYRDRYPCAYQQEIAYFKEHNVEHSL